MGRKRLDRLGAPNPHGLTEKEAAEQLWDWIASQVPHSINDRGGYQFDYDAVHRLMDYVLSDDDPEEDEPADPDWPARN